MPESGGLRAGAGLGDGVYGHCECGSRRRRLTSGGDGDELAATIESEAAQTKQGEGERPDRVTVRCDRNCHSSSSYSRAGATVGCGEQPAMQQVAGDRYDDEGDEEL